MTDLVNMMNQQIHSAANGVQTLLRGLAVIEAIAAGYNDLRSISHYISASRSTTHRLVSALIAQRYLHQNDRRGYFLGPRLVELGGASLASYPLRTAARPVLETLATETQDTVHLGVREQGDVLYIDKIPGSRGLEMRSRIGHRMPLFSTGIGKALMLDATVDEWQQFYHLHNPHTHAGSFIRTMTHYAKRGFTLDLEENELAIRCVAAPVRDASNHIVAAISVASIAPYMPDERMQELSFTVIRSAESISAELGWINKRARSLLQDSLTHLQGN